MTDIAARRNRAQRLAKTARFLITLGLFATPIDFVASVASQGLMSLLPGIPEGFDLDLSQASAGGMAALIAVAALYPAAFMVSLWLLRDLFGTYRRGVIFQAEDIRRLQHIGWSLVVLDLVSMAQRIVIGPLLYLEGIGTPFLSIGIGFSFALVGLFVIVIARIMEIGRALREFEESTV